MITIATALKRKNLAPITVSSATTVLNALRIMSDRNIGSLVVMDEGCYKGIVTERDYSRKVVLCGRNSDQTTVAEIMSTDLPVVKPEDTLATCMQHMSDRNVRYLPVMESDRLCGIISMSDVVKETILAQQETIEQLESYIRS
ncbi:MAG: hypothetical protein RJA57_1858 [Bacteroidota bacterium]|jgi:CBS domain-containing protein